MLKIVIADDEQFILKSICASVRWEKLGLSLVGACRDGIEAYHAILDENPDIVVTDIRMPGLSGLELIEKAQKISRHTVFIILSGYQEFEYARTAMQYGVRYYLIKPCSCEKMEEVLQDAMRDLKKQRMLEAAMDKNRKLMEQMNVLAVKEYLLENLSRNREEKETGLPPGVCQLVYVYFLEQGGISEFMRKAASLVKQAAERIVIYVKNTLVFVNHGEQALFSEEETNRISNIMYENQAVSLSCEVHLFEQTDRAMDELVPKIRRYSSLYLVQSNGTCIELKHYSGVFIDPEEILITCSENPEAGIKKVREYVRQFANEEPAKAFAFRLLTCIQKEFEGEISDDRLPVFWGKLARLSNPEGIADFLSDCISNFYSSQETRKPYRNFIIKTLTYAREHISDTNLSLKMIAENYLYMNTDYVSREFYRETGEKFSAYLNRIRMEEAKRLLLLAGDEDKIYNIAEQVGCANARYFGQAFKKYTGITPTTYMRQRKKSIQGEETDGSEK